MVAADSFMYFPEDVLAFFKSNTLHEGARGGAFVQVVANEDETLASPDDACWFSAFGFDMWWKLEFLDEVDELYLPVFFDHQLLLDCGRGLRVNSLLTLKLD